MWCISCPPALFKAVFLPLLQQAWKSCWALVSCGCNRNGDAQQQPAGLQSKSVNFLVTLVLCLWIALCRHTALSQKHWQPLRSLHVPLCFSRLVVSTVKGDLQKVSWKAVPSTLTVQEEYETRDRVRAKNSRSLHPPEVCIAWSLLEWLLQKVQTSKIYLQSESEWLKMRSRALTYPFCNKK